MKIKMREMTSTICGDIPCRMRGIIPTTDEKYLFIEILAATRPKIQDTNLTKEEYSIKYPYEKYLWVTDCYRVDVPEDYFNAYSEEFKKYDRKPFSNIPYTHNEVLKFLQGFNKDIEEFEVTPENYISEYCEEHGFFQLYDDRLQHSYTPLKIKWFDLGDDGKTQFNCLYTYYSSNGNKYSKVLHAEENTNDLFIKYGVDTLRALFDEFIKQEILDSHNQRYIEVLELTINNLFEKYGQTNLQKATEIDELYDLDY